MAIEIKRRRLYLECGVKTGIPEVRKASECERFSYVQLAVYVEDKL